MKLAEGERWLDGEIVDLCARQVQNEIHGSINAAKCLKQMKRVGIIIKDFTFI